MFARKLVREKWLDIIDNDEEKLDHELDQLSRSTEAWKFVFVRVESESQICFVNGNFIDVIGKQPALQGLVLSQLMASQRDRLIHQKVSSSAKDYLLASFFGEIIRISEARSVISMEQYEALKTKFHIQSRSA